LALIGSFRTWCVPVVYPRRSTSFRASSFESRAVRSWDPALSRPSEFGVRVDAARRETADSDLRDGSVRPPHNARAGSRTTQSRSMPNGGRRAVNTCAVELEAPRLQAPHGQFLRPLVSRPSSSRMLDNTRTLAAEVLISSSQSSRAASRPLSVTSVICRTGAVSETGRSRSITKMSILFGTLDVPSASLGGYDSARAFTPWRNRPATRSANAIARHFTAPFPQPMG
jgi:hypothetical protein